MKFNTLVFDANLPTTQQVNVPTNTDYKVGMKVKRNGEIQQLGPDEITIYTGEVNVIPPTQFTSDSKTCQNGIDTNLLTLKEADLSAMAGESIKYTDVYVEFSFDNGTTWSKQTPTHNSVTVRVIDRAGAANNVIAAQDLRYQNKKWILQDHGVATGEVADYVAIPEAARIQIMFLGSDWGSLTYPCLWRLVFLYGGQEIPITIPTDADKTNGYVTFTQASNDDASFRQLKVVVDVNAVPATEETELSTYVNTTGAAQSGMGIDLDLSSHQDLVGKTVTPLDVKFCTIAGTGTTPPTEDALKAGLADIWNDAIANAAVKIYPDKSIINNYLMCPATNVRQAYIEQMGAPADKPFFVKFVNGSYDSWLTDYTFGASDSIVPSKNKVTNNNSRGWAIQVKLDDAVPGWNANFKLNINEFKSQCGDINAQTDPEFNTAKVEGTYEDGTEFSYDFCIQ